MSQKASEMPIELHLNHPKPSRQGTTGRNLVRSNSLRGPLPPEMVVIQRIRPQTEHNYTVRVEIQINIVNG